MARMGDSRSHWRAGAYALEHEIVVSGSAHTSALHDLQWLPEQTDESISFYFDEPNGRLAKRGILVSLYGLTSSPAFGLRLRLKEALGWNEGWRHGVSITMPVASREATVVGDLRHFAGTYVADSLARHVADLGAVSFRVSLAQTRRRWLLRDARSSEFVTLSQDSVMFETSEASVANDFVEVSTYEWPIRSSYLSERVRDTLQAIDGRAVKSKIQWFQGRTSS